MEPQNNGLSSTQVSLTHQLDNTPQYCSIGQKKCLLQRLSVFIQRFYCIHTRLIFTLLLHGFHWAILVLGDFFKERYKVIPVGAKERSSSTWFLSLTIITKFGAMKIQNFSMTIPGSLLNSCPVYGHEDPTTYSYMHDWLAEHIERR